MIRKRHRVVGIGALLALLASCHGSAEPPEKEEPIAVRCEAPKPVAVEETIALRGRLAPPPGGDLPVAAQVAGRVAQVTVHEGDVIKPGDVVAVLDDASSRDSARQAEAAVTLAQATASNADATLARTKALVARGIAAKQEEDDATARAAEARANVSAATAAADLARRTLGRVAVRSSLGGIVTKVWRGLGALVDGTAATPIVQLAANSALEMVAEATAAQLIGVHEGDRVSGTLEGGGTFAGVVRASARALDPATGLGAVRIALTEADGAALIGAYGRALVSSRHRAAVPTLPAIALRGAVADGAEVAVCNRDHVEIRAIQAGWRGDDRFELVAGLKPGEKVAVDHVLGLEDDTPIRERDETAAGTNGP